MSPETIASRTQQSKLGILKRNRQTALQQNAERMTDKHMKRCSTPLVIRETESEAEGDNTLGFARSREEVGKNGILYTVNGDLK